VKEVAAMLLAERIADSESAAPDAARILVAMLD
jgi:hypothetical protein